MATVYNTLRAFCDAGLLHEITVDGTKSYFDTNTHDHPHFYWEDDAKLSDAPAEELKIMQVPDAPDGTEIASIDVVIRLRKKDNPIQTYSAFGPAKDVMTLVQMDTPIPAAGEVLVELEYSGANPSDAKARAGARPGVTKPAFDVIIPNSDGAGIITAVGQGVDPARIGSRVWI